MLQPSESAVESAESCLHACIYATTQTFQCSTTVYATCTFFGLPLSVHHHVSPFPYCCSCAVSVQCCHQCLYYTWLGCIPSSEMLFTCMSIPTHTTQWLVVLCRDQDEPCIFYVSIFSELTQFRKLSTFQYNNTILCMCVWMVFVCVCVCVCSSCDL